MPDHPKSEPQATDPLCQSRLEPERWVEQFGNSLYRFALARVRHESIAEDLVQETFVAGWRGRHSFSGDSSVSTWLFAILKRKIADHFRRANRVESAEEINQLADAPPGNNPRRNHQVQDPADIFEDREFWGIFHGCVEKLPDLLAEAYTLRELNRLSTDEICKLLAITPTNLSMRLRRARIALGKCLQDNWFGEQTEK